MYDPEGILATLPAVLNVWVGLHFGRVIKFQGMQETRTKIQHWGVLASSLIALGVIIHFSGWKMNKQLWSPA